MTVNDYLIKKVLDFSSLADDLAEDSCTIEPSSGPPVLQSRGLGNQISFAGRLSYYSSICVRGIVKCNEGSKMESKNMNYCLQIDDPHTVYFFHSDFTMDPT
jgi:hypothetical protein